MQPTFEATRRRAYKLLGDARDELRSDVRDLPVISDGQAQHLRDALRLIEVAKSHLDAAARR